MKQIDNFKKNKKDFEKIEKKKGIIKTYPLRLKSHLKTISFGEFKSKTSKDLIMC